MLADRLKTLAPSSTLAVQAKARELRAKGIDVISFGAGEPDFDTPQRIKDAAVEAMRRGQTKYTEVGGIPELRGAVCVKLKRDNGLAYEPADVLVSVGARTGSRTPSRRAWSAACRSRWRRPRPRASTSIPSGCGRR